MSHSNGTRAEASVSSNIYLEQYFYFIFKSGSQTQVIEGFKKVQTRLKTLVLTLENFNNIEKDKKSSKSTTKRESFLRELNQMRDEIVNYVNDIENQLHAIRPRNTNDENYIDKIQTYLMLVQLTTDILKKLNQLFTEIFDRFRAYIDELWKHMVNHDDAQARRVTREFNEFFNEKTSSSNKLFDDIQQIMDDIDDAESNWKEK